MTLTLPSAPGQGYLLLNTGNQAVPLAGDVDLPEPSAVRGAVFISPDPQLLQALPTWVLNKALMIAGASSETFDALARHTDLERLILTSAISSSVLQLVGDGEREAVEGEPFAVDASRLAQLQNLQHLELLHTSLGDHDLAQLAHLPKLSYLRLRGDEFTGEFLTKLTPLAAQLTFVQVSGEHLLGKYLSALPTLPAATAAAFMGPHIFAELDPLALRSALPAAEFLNLFGQVVPDEDNEESEQSFKRLLPFRAAFTSADVNGMRLTEKGAKRAAKRLDVQLPTSQDKDA